MKNIKLATAVILFAGFWGGGQAAAHNHSRHGDRSMAPAAAAAEDPGTVKGVKVKGADMTKEKALKAALKKHNCLLCHKYQGKGGKSAPALDEHLKHHSNEDLKKQLKTPKKPMPPFSGTEKELDKFVETINYKAAHMEAGGDSEIKRAAKSYVCPMGDYQGDKPGKCPVCGMDLVEKK